MHVTFWKRTRETFTRRRNPLFDPRLGISVWRSVTIDLMHTLHLGVMSTFCKFAIMKIITDHIVCRMPTIEETLSNSVIVLAQHWKLWKTNFKRQNPGIKMSGFRFDAKIIGAAGTPKMNLKAAQTWYFLLWLIKYLSEVSHRMDQGDKVLAAARAMQTLVNTIRDSPMRMPRRAIQQCWDQWLMFLNNTQDHLEVPKIHLAMHLLNRMSWFGCPTAYANWADESANLTFKKCCRGISQTTFEAVVLLEMLALRKV